MFQPWSSSKQEICSPVYHGGGTIGAKIFEFRLFDSLKNALSRTFRSPKLSLES